MPLNQTKPSHINKWNDHKSEVLLDDLIEFFGTLKYK